MTSGVGGYGALAKRFECPLVEVERHDHGRLLAAVDEHGGLAGEAGARDHLAEDVARLGDLRAVFGAGRGHGTTVADSLLTSTPHIRFLSYDGYEIKVFAAQLKRPWFLTPKAAGRHTQRARSAYRMTTTNAELPKPLAESLAGTLQHIRLIQEKEARLAQACRAALEQALQRIGSDYRTGQITQTQLCLALTEIQGVRLSGRMNAWDEIVGVPWKRLAQLSRQLPNGPEGSWVGEHPIPASAPRPISGVPVVYVLFDEANEPCYVGSTDKFSSRMNAHVKSGKSFVRWQAHPCDDREHAYRLEDRLLKRHKPYLNRKASR